MARHTRKQSDIGFAAISIVGGLISPDKIAQIASVSPDTKTAESYSCPKGTSLRDEIARYFRIGQAEWQAFSKIENPTFDQCTAFAKSLLEEVFGFSHLQGPKTRRSEGHSFKIALEGKNGRVPIVVAPPATGDDLDGFKVAYTAFGDAEGGRTKRRPDALLQEWLNASEPALWGLVFAGDRVRLMRDNASFTRPAFIEADLGAIFRDEMFADFTALWLLIHATRFGNEGAAVTDCPLERWREEGVESGTAARDRLRENVEEALLSLGQGFLEGNPDLRDKLDGGTLSDQRWFEQLLRVVYRLIFIAVTEERDLLHEPDVRPEIRKLYAEGYSFAHMRERSTRRTLRDPHGDVWEGTRVLFRALDKGQAKLGLPALSGIFDEGLTPDLNEARIANKHFLNVIYRLSFIHDEKTRVRINWRDMATEELGSVYEGLLELVPIRTNHGRDFAFAGGDEARGNARKTSGSYYTPDSLVQTLLDSALDPVLDEAEANGGADAILNLTVIDPACGSAHFLLGAARRMAERVAKLRDSENPDFQHALRDVVRRCIYGVDRNPMAVELAKVALWIEAVEPGKPLGFLDANIRCGDALLGVYDLKVLETGIPDAAYKPLAGDDRDAANHYRDKNKREVREREQIASGFGFNQQQDFMREFSRLRAMPEDTVKQIAAKAEKLRALTAEGQAAWTLKAACDLYVSSFILPKEKDGPHAGPDGLPRRGAEIVATSGTIWEWLRGVTPFGPLLDAATEAAATARAFHWPLEFPSIIERGGFDVVIGNPPWERIKLQEKEFFAARDPEIAAAPNAAARTRRINALRDAEHGTPNRALWEDFQTAKRLSEALSTFVRVDADDGGRFDRTGTGDVNTYALFAELFATLAGPTGRAGVIVPTGIATDATTAPFFAHLVEERRLSSLIDFENGAPIFPSVHRSFKFCLLTLGRDVSEARFAFFLKASAELSEPERNFTLSPEQIAAINPNTKTIPVFRSRADAELTAKIYRNAPVLIDEGKGAAGNPWGVSFMAMFHMSNDSGLFRTCEQLTAEGYTREGTDWTLGNRRFVPLYEAKMIHQFDHRWAGYGPDGATSSDATLEQKADPSWEPTPRYWVPDREVKLRTAPFPKEITKAILNREPELVGLHVAYHLFAEHIAKLGIDDVLERGLFLEWKAFVDRFPALRSVAPVRFGFCGDSPALLRPMDNSSLPSSAIDEIVSNENQCTAWYQPDASVMREHLSNLSRVRWTMPEIEALDTEEELLDYGETMLEAAVPKWTLGWRRNARNTDERTMIVHAFPSGIGIGDSIFLLNVSTSGDLFSGMFGNLNSLPLDFVARQKVSGINMSYYFINQFPVLPPEYYTELRLAFITPKVRELAYASHKLAPFALDMGYDGAPFAWDADRRALLRAELDAFYARAYGLSRDELRYILDPTDVKGEDYPSETFRVLKDKETRNFGEYRTRRLVLEAWDRLESSGEFKAMEM